MNFKVVVSRGGDAKIFNVETDKLDSEAVRFVESRLTAAVQIGMDDTIRRRKLVSWNPGNPADWEWQND